MANPSYLSEPDRYMSAGNADWPARYATAITPSDTLPVACGPGALATPPSGTYAKALYIGVTGDVNVITAGDNSAGGLGTAVLFKAVPVGWFPVQVRAVLATGTTASQIVGLSD